MYVKRMKNRLIQWEKESLKHHYYGEHYKLRICVNKYREESWCKLWDRNARACYNMIKKALTIVTG